MTGQLPLDAEPVAEELDQQRVLGHEPHPTQLDVLGQGPTEDGQGLLVVVVTEVVDSLGLDRQRLQFLGHESELGGDRRHRVEDLLDMWREHGGRQVVEDDVGRTIGHGCSPWHAIMADVWSSP